MTAFEDVKRNRLRPPLPALNLKVGREPVLEEDKLPARLKHTSNPLNGRHDAGNGAQREGTHNRIDRTVWQRNAFARKVQELDLHLRLSRCCSARRIMPGLGSNA